MREGVLERWTQGALTLDQASELVQDPKVQVLFLYCGELYGSSSEWSWWGGDNTRQTTTMMALKYWQGADVGVDSPKVTVSCRLGAYWFYLGYSTTERVLSYVCGALSLFCFLLPHPRGCRATDNTRTKHSRYSTLCQSTKPFDCVSTLTDAVAPTEPVFVNRECFFWSAFQDCEEGPRGEVPSWWIFRRCSYQSTRVIHPA